VSTQSGRREAWQAFKAVLRLCSLRNVTTLFCGVILALLPVVQGPASSAVAVLPYVPGYPHQAYGYQLALTRLQHDAPARDWLAAADRAILSPQSVDLPLAVTAELGPPPSAVGYRFSLPAGRRLTVTVGGDPSHEVFVDVFRPSGLRHERVAGRLPRSSAPSLDLDAVEGGDYVVRVQSALGATVAYDIAIEAAPLLAFPVVGVDERAIWSGFGAERDGGRREHRGVDIFAARGTPALAATDGWVTRVETTRRGGNVVWLQPLFGNMRVYYAHLDEQWVAPGDFVVAGQPLGAIGNTGNAITTPPHLHFGVYVRRPGVRGGARDPAEFLR
jgi:murein DD-endopeptidase MepM/ murein hydrolase activator NlpD